MKSAYTQEIAESICEQLAQGKSLNAICKQDGMPDESTVRAWAKDNKDGFSPKYTRAREIGYERLADEILEISDEEVTMVKRSKHQSGASPDEDTPENEIEVVFDPTAVARNRLRVDTRKWMLSKMLPKVYGDKLELASDPKSPLMTGLTVTFVKPDGTPS